MTDKTDEKKQDILEDVKKVERFKKAQVLAEAIGEIKSYAKEVLVLKEKTEILLEEIGISSEDSKRVIDYVNSLVKLTEADKKKVREDARSVKQEKEEKIDRKMDKTPFPLNGIMTAYTSATNTISQDTNWTPANYTVSLGNTGYNIKV